MGMVHGSDAGMVVACMAPLALLGLQGVRRDFWKVALMGAEAGFTSLGVVGIAKGAVQRVRPFVYGTEAPLAERLRPDARLSFFSGHTTLAATASFFGARLYADYVPNSRLRPWIWVGAAVLPAGMGAMRVLAGKHFLSDVVVGYAVGASVGWLVPWLHRDRGEAQVSVMPLYWRGGSGVGVSWRF